MPDKIDISAIARVIDQASGPLKQIQGGLKGVGETAKSAGAALARMATQGAFGGVAASIGRVRTAFGQVGQAARGLFAPVAKVAGLLGFAGIAGTIASMREYIAEVTQLGKVARRTGASREMVQGFNLLTGSAENAEQVLTLTTKGLAKLATAKKPDPRVVEVFNKMGISLKDVRTGAISMDQILTKLAAGFAKQTNPISKMQIATVLAGKSGKQLNDILSRGPEYIQSYVREAQKRSGIDDQHIKQAGEAITAQRYLGASIKGVKDAILGAFLPAYTEASTALDQYIVKARQTWLSNDNLRSVVNTVVTELKGFWQGIKLTVSQLGGWQNIMIALGAYMAKDFIGSVGKLGIEIAKLGASAISLNPLSLALAGVGVAAGLAVQNWDKIGPAVEAKFAQVGVAAQQAWTGIKQWASQSWQEILRGFQTGGIWGAINAASFAAIRGIIQGWDSIVGWFSTNFPEAAAAVSSTWEAIKSTAQSAWRGISDYAVRTIGDIVAGWRSGGIEGAATATWNAIRDGITGVARWIGDTLRNIPWAEIGNSAAALFSDAWRIAGQIAGWLRDRLREIDWPGIGEFARNSFEAAFRAASTIGQGIIETLRNADWQGIASFAGASFAAAWRGALNIIEWLRSLNWEEVGQQAGAALVGALNAAFAALEGIDRWIAQQDWPAISRAVVEGFATVVDAALDIGLRFIEGMIKGMINGIPGLRQVVDTISNFFAQYTPQWIQRFFQRPEAAQAAAGAAPVVAAAQAVPAEAGEVVARAGLPPPLAPAITPAVAPTVAQPSLLQQARETQVRIDGEISQRLRVDMSPDLRAMLTEQRAQIADLRTRQQVEIGQSMAPALGLA